MKQAVRALAVLILLAGAGCSDDPAAPAFDPYGTHVLMSRNGTPIPVTVDIATAEGQVTTITSGTLELNANDTHLAMLHVRVLPERAQTPVASTITLGAGAFTWDTTAVSLSLTPSTSIDGTFSGAGRRTLTLETGEPWGTLVFMRLNP